MSDLNKLETVNGKRTLITGVTGGLGEIIAKKFKDCGQEIIGIGRSQEKLNKLNSYCDEKIVLNLNDEQDVKNFSKQIKPIDNIILSNGIHGARPLRMTSKQYLNDIIQSNLISTLDFLANLIRSNKINRPGRIIFISSISSQIGANTAVPYAASKAGTEAALAGLARDVLKKEITVNSICPAPIETPLWQGNIKNVVTNLHDYPLGLGKPEDVANACIFLCLNGSKFITGEKIIMDGGANWIL